MVLLFHFLPFLGLLLHVDGKVHKRKKVEIKYEYLPQVYKTSKLASHTVRIIAVLTKSRPNHTTRQL